MVLDQSGNSFGAGRGGAKHFGRPRQVDYLRPGVRDQPNQPGETPFLLKKNTVLARWGLIVSSRLECSGAIIAFCSLGFPGGRQVIRVPDKVVSICYRNWVSIEQRHKKPLLCSVPLSAFLAFPALLTSLRGSWAARLSGQGPEQATEPMGLGGWVVLTAAQAEGEAEGGG
ncbi:hypothetical protein AAY473_036302 [Plecturocebus cupreus]